MRPIRKFARVENTDSVVRGNERSMVDAGLSLGRSFRVGWGPGGIIAHLGSLCSPFTTSYGSRSLPSFSISFNLYLEQQFFFQFICPLDNPNPSGFIASKSRT